MSHDELVRFEAKWKEIFSQGIEKVFRCAETKQANHFDIQQYTRLYT